MMSTVGLTSASKTIATPGFASFSFNLSIKWIRAKTGKTKVAGRVPGQAHVVV